jgi:hypothetical protein
MRTLSGSVPIVRTMAPFSPQAELVGALHGVVLVQQHGGAGQPVLCQKSADPKRGRFRRSRGGPGCDGPMFELALRPWLSYLPGVLQFLDPILRE